MSKVLETKRPMGPKRGTEVWVSRGEGECQEVREIEGSL